MSDFSAYDPNSPGIPYPGQGGFNGSPCGPYNCAFPQQNPNQFYQMYPMGDPTLPIGPPQNISAPYEFRRRINKMNWDMIGNVDVSTIAKTNDVQSIEFLMSPIAFANISNDDSEHFGSRACLHAFLLLQLSVEYLLFKINTTPPPTYIPAPQTMQQQMQPNQTIANYEARIDLLNKDIKSRDLIINSLSDKMHQAESERDALKARIQSMKNTQSATNQSRDLSSEISEIPRKKRITAKRNERDETGLIHPDSELQEYKATKVRVKSKDQNKEPKKTKKKEQEFESYSYDYSESDFLSSKNHPKKKGPTKTKKMIEVDDDWGSSSGWN